MKLFSALELLSPYLFKVSIINGYIWFDFKFPVHWVIPESVSELVGYINFGEEVSDNGERNTLIRLVCEFSEKDVSDTESKAIEFINYNLELARKEELFMESTKVLKKIFMNRSLEELSNIKITFDGEDDKMAGEGSGEGQEGN